MYPAPGEHGGRLEFAHLSPTDVRGRGRGQWERYLDVKRHPDRYLLLCHTHHRFMDRKHLHQQFKVACTPVSVSTSGASSTVAATPVQAIA